MVIGESQLNVYIVGADNLSPHHKERLQAQVQQALRAIPQWAFTLLRRRLIRLGLSSFPLIIQPQVEGAANPQALSVGSLGDKPAVCLMPVIRGDDIDWRQERRHLLAKALAYLAAPGPQEDEPFWQRWQEAIRQDGLAGMASQVDERWQAASSLDLLLEMFAAYVLNPRHRRWKDLPTTRAFLEGWKATALS